MPVPTPKSGESEQDYISRCMGDDNMQEYEQDQRSAICYSKYRESNVSKNLQTAMILLQDHIIKLEKEEARKLYEPELEILNEKVKKDIEGITDKGIEMVEDIYLRCRKDNNEIDKSYEVAKSIYNKEFDKVSQTDVLKTVEKIVQDIISKVKVNNG